MKTKKASFVVKILTFAVLLSGVAYQTAYAIPKVSTPVATPPGGTYVNSPLFVYLSSPDTDFFFYTTDGSTPDYYSPQKHNNEPAGITHSSTLKVLAIQDGMIDSDVMSETYTFIDPVSVYRFWSDQKQGHFYTVSAEERDAIIANDPSWTYEGAAFSGFGGAASEVSPVYRFWSEQKHHHFFTISAAEKDSIIVNDPSWAYEGIAYYAFSTWQPATNYVFRFWSEQKQGHFYTTSNQEKDDIMMNDPSWTYEGVAWYVPNPLYY